MANTIERIRLAWNVFTNRSPTIYSGSNGGSYSRPDRHTPTNNAERAAVNAIYNQISIDCASIDIRHVLVDANDRYLKDIDSGLTECLKFESNIDQTGRAMIQDGVLSMLDEGSIAMVSVDYERWNSESAGKQYKPEEDNELQIYTMRVGKVTQWYPDSVDVDLYNEKTGNHQTVNVPKRRAAIIENPFYSIMNKPNSTLRRLNRKLYLLDRIDETDYSKLNMIIQLPYQTKSPMKRRQAQERINDIEDQMANSKYGIAYIDGTEHVTQLNRSLDNGLLEQIKMLQDEIYGQLGMCKAIFDGTADEQTMLNYFNRTISPIMSAITEEMTRKFLTKEERKAGQRIVFIRNPFKLVPINNIADIADKFTRNAILSSNEVRGLIGFKPVDDPDADILRNKNLNKSNEEMQKTPPNTDLSAEEAVKNANQQLKK